MFAQTFVDTFVVSAENYQVLLERELVGEGLCEEFAVGGGVDDIVVMAFGLQFLDAVGEWLDGHHHAGIASIGVVVDAAIASKRVVVKVVEMHLDEAFLLSTADNAFFKEHGKHVGE